MSKLFKELKIALEEAIAHNKGKLDLRSEIIEILEPPTQCRSKEIKKCRLRIL